MAEAAAVFKDKKIRKFLSNVDKKLKDIKGGANRYVTKVSPIAFKDVIEHFEGEMGPTGPWQKWAPSTLAQYERLGKSGNNILQDSGALRQSTKPALFETSANRNEILLLVNNAQTKDGFPYAFAHDNDTAPRSKLPRRSFMWLSNKALNNIAITTLNFLEKEA